MAAWRRESDVQPFSHPGLLQVDAVMDPPEAPLRLLVRRATVDSEFDAQATSLNCWTDINHSAIRFELTEFWVTISFLPQVVANAGKRQYAHVQ
jgi:hypothetical protein